MMINRCIYIVNCGILVVLLVMIKFCLLVGGGYGEKIRVSGESILIYFFYVKQGEGIRLLGMIQNYLKYWND